MKIVFLAVLYLAATLGLMSQVWANDEPVIVAVVPVVQAQPARVADTAARDPLDPPVFQVGDSCTYRQKEWGIEKTPYSEVVVAVNGERITTQLINETSKRVMSVLWRTPTGGILASGVGGSQRIDNVPAREFFHFPIVPGPRAAGYTEYRKIPQQGMVRVNYILTETFLGIETVSVPAGSIQAIGVRLAGTYEVIPENASANALYGNRSGTINQEVWYSTRLACTVKREVYISSGRESAGANTLELTAFRRQGLAAELQAKQ